jgi:hypothetical protein
MIKFTGMQGKVCESEMLATITLLKRGYLSTIVTTIVVVIVIKIEV